MKRWPDDETQTVNFERLVTPLAKILRENYNELCGDIPAIEYAGYDIGSSEKACSFSPDETLSYEKLIYHKDQGRDLLDVVLGIAVQLGIEQGRRISNKAFKLEKLLLLHEKK